MISRILIILVSLTIAFMGFRQVSENLNPDEVVLEQIKPSAYTSQKIEAPKSQYFVNEDIAINALEITSSPLNIEHISIFISSGKKAMGAREIMRENKANLEIKRSKDLKLFHKLLEDLKPVSTPQAFEYHMVCKLVYEDENREILGINTDGQLYYQGKIYEGSEEVISWLHDRI